MGEPRERRYVAEYAARFLPPGSWMSNVPLGPIPGDILAQYGLEAGRMLFRPSRPRVDLVHWSETEYWLIEGKVFTAKSGIGDLLTYAGLIPSTQDLPGYHGQRLRLRMIVPWTLDWVRDAARGHDIELIEFAPAWIEDYVRRRQDYFTREAKLARDERIRLRRTLGVE